MKLLLDAKADVNHLGAEEDTPFTTACKEGNVDCLRLLIERKADVTHTKKDGTTGLMCAIDNSGNSECVKLLLEAKVDVNQQLKSNPSAAIHCASAKGHVKSLRLLIEHKATVGARGTNCGYTDLMLAAQYGHSECVKLLLDANVNINRRQGCALASEHVCADTSDTALSKAVGKGNADCVAVLLDSSGAGIFPATPAVMIHALQVALKEKNSSLVFMLLACGADLDKASSETSKTQLIGVISRYERVMGFAEKWHLIGSRALSAGVEVDARVGLAQNGLYQEPLERVMEYLGLSVVADQVLNTSINREGQLKRVLLANCAHAAKQWHKRFEVALSNMPPSLTK